MQATSSRPPPPLVCNLSSTWCAARGPLDLRLSRSSLSYSSLPLASPHHPQPGRHALSPPLFLEQASHGRHCRFSPGIVAASLRATPLPLFMSLRLPSFLIACLLQNPSRLSSESTESELPSRRQPLPRAASSGRHCPSFSLPVLSLGPMRFPDILFG